MPDPSSVTQALAEYCAEAGFDQLPDRTVFRAKCVILDELACMVLGRRLPVGERLASYVQGMGGTPEATVAGTPVRVPAALAALANGTAGHADELDGSHVSEGHPGASILAASLAVGEKAGATGKQFLTAVVLGYDVGTRLVDVAGGRMRMQTEQHLHSDFLHAFGAAAAAGSLLGLTPEAHRHAAALTGAQTTSLAAFFDERLHMSKSFTYGHIGYCGVTAALLAQAGVEGNDAIFEAPHGVFDAWAVEGGHDALHEGLGTRYAIVDSNFKFYSAGYPIHSPLEATLGLMADHGLGSADIDAIHVAMNTNCVRTVDRRQMPSICIQDMLPVGIAFGRLGFEEAHDPANLDLGEVKRLREGVTVEVDPAMDRENPRGRGARVRLRLADGRELERAVDWPYGHSRRGDVRWDELVGKAHDMLDRTHGAERVSRFVQAVDGIESLADVSVIGEAMASAG